MSIDIDEMLDPNSLKENQDNNTPKINQDQVTSFTLHHELQQMYIEKPEKKDEEIKKENKFLKFFINHVVIPYGSRIPKTIQYLCEKLEIEDMEQIMLFINKTTE